MYEKEKKESRDNRSPIYHLGKDRREICRVVALAALPFLSALISMNSEAMGPKKESFRRTMSARRRVGPPLRGQTEWP